MSSRPSWYQATLILACAFLAMAPFAAAQIPTGQAPPHKAHPPATPESIAQGKKIFDGTCAVCHGVWGGVIGSGMPNFSYLGQDKIWDVVDYVSTLGQSNGGTVTGNAQKGKEVYDSNGCASCHSIDGEGGSSGPDLSNIGALRSASFLRDEILNPGANKPTGEPGLPSRAAYEAYRMYRVTLANGKTVTGMRVNESSFSLQLRDAQGNIISVNKLTAKNIEELPGKSFMPSYKGKLSDEQVNDLVAYLASLEVQR
jgi:cytochrome c oxidase cbb3-type subunit 3